MPTGDGVSHLQDPDNPQHELVITLVPGSNRLLRLRCKCMAEYRNVSRRYYNYDWFAECDVEDDVMALYWKHLDEWRARRG